MESLLGIDEAGRAPLAGPVAVGFVLVPLGFDVVREFPGVKDSKKLSKERREEIYRALVERKRKGDVRFCVRFSDHLSIDELGMTRAVRRAIVSGARYLAPEPDEALLMLDGALYAPSHYAQRTVIHGDDLVPLISLASIAAKVERDRLMKRLSKKYPQYGFEKHKGYGTRAHWKAIQLHGLCAIHRRTYCKLLLDGANTSFDLRAETVV